jgi:FkbM family methyltransferase
VTGVGAGLRFNAAGSNPGYALGTNEPPVQEALANYLRAGDIFYDIGANVGFFTVIGAKLVGQTGHVYAFEPVPENAASIRRNIELNNFAHVTLFEKAVSHSTGKGELLLSHCSGGATLSSAGTSPDVKGTISIELISIDDLVAQQKIAPPAVVKIDVEGAELDVLQGMSQTIKKFKPVIIYEVDDEKEGPFQQKLKACDAFVQTFGYELTTLQDSYPKSGWKVGHTVAVPKLNLYLGQ